MGKSKVHMPKDLEVKCHQIIHAASTAAAAAGAIPIPMSDAIPITAVQIGMIVKLGNVFGITLTEASAKAITGVCITQSAGRALFTNLVKLIPGGGLIVGGTIGAATAAALTEALGWLVADDFYRMSNGEAAKDIPGNASTLKTLFENLRFSKKG